MTALTQQPDDAPPDAANPPPDAADVADVADVAANVSAVAFAGRMLRLLLAAWCPSPIAARVTPAPLPMTQP